MKKGLFIFILCLSIMLIGCPAATSGDANDANGTNTGSNGGNGGSSNSGNNSGNGGSGTGNTGVITSVENEFVYFDMEKFSYVGSVTWKAENDIQTGFFADVNAMKFVLYDANDTERGYIPVNIEKNSSAKTITGTVEKNTFVQYGNNDDYGILVYDIPGIVVKAKLFITGQTSPEIIKEQKGLVSKNNSAKEPKNGSRYEERFVSYKYEGENNSLIKYSFNWVSFYNETRIFPASVKLSSLGITSKISKIDWTDPAILNVYFDLDYSSPIQIKNFQVKESEDEDDNTVFILESDNQSKNMPDNDSSDLELYVVSTRGETYKFITQFYAGSIQPGWTYMK